MTGRQKARVLVHKAVTINGSVAANCFDINEEGMYIQSEVSYKRGDVIALSFAVGGKPIRVQASVRHVEQDFGFGVRFIDLPAADRQHILEHLKAGTPPAHERKIILLVDSKEQARTVYRNKLYLDGYTIVEAADGNEAFSYLQSGRPDIVIIDNLISGINAYKLLQFMQTREELRAIPAIMLTTRLVPAEAERVLALGVSDYLVKATTTPKHLSERVKALLTS